MTNMRKLTMNTAEDVLDALGLMVKPSGTSSALGAIGTFGIGLLVGAGVALLLAPKAGTELRQDLRSTIGRAKERVQGATEELEDRIS